MPLYIPVVCVPSLVGGSNLPSHFHQQSGDIGPEFVLLIQRSFMYRAAVKRKTTLSNVTDMKPSFSRITFDFTLKWL